MLARLAYHLRGDLERLDAVDGLLHGGIDILHPDTDAIEAQRRQERQGAGTHSTRIDLD